MKLQALQDPLCRKSAPTSIRVHRPGNRNDSCETIRGEVHSLVHHSDDLREQLKVVPLRRVQWITFEERNHFQRQVLSIPDNEYVCPIAGAPTMVGLDVSAIQPLLDCLEDVSAGDILADVEFGNGLPSDPSIGAALEGNVKAALSVHKACDVVVVHNQHPWGMDV